MPYQRQILTVIILIGLVVGGYWGYQQFLAPRPDNAGETATPSPVNSELAIVSAEGQIVPVQRANLAFPAGGIIAEILVSEGQLVPAGTALARLQAGELESAVAQAEAAVAQAQAGLQLALAQVAAAQSGRDMANLGIQVAEAQLNLLLAGARPEEIAALSSNIAAANALISQAAAQRDLVLAGPSEAQIAAAEAQLAAAEAEEQQLQLQYDQILLYGIGGPQEIALRQALQAAQAASEAARIALRELQEGASEAQEQAAGAGISAAVAQRDAAQAQLDLLLAGSRPEQITLLEIGVAQAQAAVAQAETAITQAQALVVQAEAAIAQAEAAKQAAQTALERMTLTAPFTGTVAALLIKVGETVGPGIPAVRLADFSSWQVETSDLTELDVVTVAVGQEVEVRLDAISQQILPGRVKQIAAVSTLTRGDITYAVTITLAETNNLPLRWGMTAFVDIDVRP